MRVLRFSVLGIFVFFSKMLFSQILISSFMDNPTGADSEYEYIEFVATEDIDFSVTPYTVIVCNNGTILKPKGWATASTLTYGFELNSGKVSRGDLFYVGGSDPRLNGENSEDLSSLNWIVNFDYINNPSPCGIGLKKLKTVGLIGNGGSSADGIAVFNNKASDIDETTVPMECVFYGDAIGDAADFGYLLPDGSTLNSGSSFYKTNGKQEYIRKIKGMYDFLKNKWVETPVLEEVKAVSIQDISSEIALAPSVYNISPIFDGCKVNVSWDKFSKDVCDYLVCVAPHNSKVVFPDKLKNGVDKPLYAVGEKLPDNDWTVVYNGPYGAVDFSITDGDYDIAIFPIKQQVDVYDTLRFFEEYNVSSFSVVKRDFPKVLSHVSYKYDGKTKPVGHDFSAGNSFWKVVGLKVDEYECPTTDSIYSNLLQLTDSCGNDSFVKVSLSFDYDVFPKKNLPDTTLYTCSDYVDFVHKISTPDYNCQRYGLNIRNDSVSILPVATHLVKYYFEDKLSGKVLDSCEQKVVVERFVKDAIVCYMDTTVYLTCGQEKSVFDITPIVQSVPGFVLIESDGGEHSAGDFITERYCIKDKNGCHSDTCSFDVFFADTSSCDIICTDLNDIHLLVDEGFSANIRLQSPSLSGSCCDGSQFLLYDGMLKIYD